MISPSGFFNSLGTSEPYFSLFKHFDYKNFEILLNKWEENKRDEHCKNYYLNNLKENYKSYIDQATIKNIIE